MNGWVTEPGRAGVGGSEPTMGELRRFWCRAAHLTRPFVVVSWFGDDNDYEQNPYLKRCLRAPGCAQHDGGGNAAGKALNALWSRTTVVALEISCGYRGDDLTARETLAEQGVAGDLLAGRFLG
jgi:hypothetical protein